MAVETLSINDLLTDTRYMLGDTAIKRWSNARLITLLNECLLDISLRTEACVDRKYVYMPQNASYISMQDVAIKILRISYDDEYMDLLSHRQMDELYREWQDRESNRPLAIVYDRQNSGEFRVFPKFVRGEVDNPEPEILGPDGTAATAHLGIFRDLDFANLDLTMIDDEGFGNLQIEDQRFYLLVYYIKKFPRFDEDDVASGTVELNRFWRQAISHYIASRALMDSRSEQDLAAASAHLQYYRDELEAFNAEKQSQFVQADFETGFNTVWGDNFSNNVSTNRVNSYTRYGRNNSGDYS